MQQLESFHQFGKERIDRGAGESIGDLFMQWQIENRTPEEKAEDIAAIQASLDDLRRGVPTRDVAEVLEELRLELGLSAEQ
jgi:hypothetical protein